MSIFTDGLAVLNKQSWTVFSILLTVVWGQIIIVALLQKIFKDQLTISEIISLSFAGWILPVVLLSVLLFAGVILFGGIAIFVISGLAAIALTYAMFVGKLNRATLASCSWFGIAFVVFLISQLAFLKNLLLPSYFDSAEHYRIIKYFVEYYASLGGNFPLINYYHVGFHLLSATISQVFQLGIVDIMLVFGQILLAVLPFSLFFILKRETESNAAAIFACLLAGVGWHMPAHLVDWGKYPALFSLVGIHFVLNMGYLAYKKNQSKTGRFAFHLFLCLGALVSVFLHTRSLIIFGFMGISLLLVIWRQRLLPLFQQLAFAFVILILIVEMLAVQNNAMLALLFGTYARADVLTTSLVIFLLIFAAWKFPNLTFFLLILISLMMAGLFIPVTGFLGYGDLTLLDRPYVQMLLYLPLSIFGGLGLAGLNQFLQRSIPLQKITVALLVILVVLNANARHSFYPSDCCQIVSSDDLSAIHWMDKTLPSNASILIASTNLLVTSFESPDALAGVDGGVWINPLISRKTTPARGNSNFAEPEIHAQVCQKKISYIYVGGTSQSFNSLQLDKRADWYQLVFSLPKAKVYRVVGCQ
ncbi:MAG: hypothetical protein U0V02_19860 [Anaerolineales bacterium]